MENDGLQLDEQTLADLDSTDLTDKAEPRFEGTVAATLRSVRPYREKIKGTETETGRLALIFSFAFNNAMKEFLTDEGGVAQEYPPGHRIEKWVDFKHAEGTSEGKRKFAAIDRKELAKAFGLNLSEGFGADVLRKIIDKPVQLCLSVSQMESGGYFQNTRVKAPVSSNGSH